MSQFSLSMERIYVLFINLFQTHNIATTLLHRGDGLWESTYSLYVLYSVYRVLVIMTVACFDGSDSEEFIISVIAGMYVC